MKVSPPTLIISINQWSLLDRRNADGSEWSAEQRLRAIAEAGFQACAFPEKTPDLKAMLQAHGLRFGGAFDAATQEEMRPRIAAILEIDNGPINCQLADHDTPVEKAIQLTIDLMDAADELGAEVHLEMHRDTCTETPEKTYAIIDGYRAAKGRNPRVNFDFSHPACLKHLNATNYIDRLFENIPVFQAATLWHMRPFNGHHCQVPVTDGQGGFTPEYEDMRPFIRHALTTWLQGPRPHNELWVMPEIGPKGGYALSSFPDAWDDAVACGKDIQKIWKECLLAVADEGKKPLSSIHPTRT